METQWLIHSLSTYYILDRDCDVPGTDLVSRGGDGHRKNQANNGEMTVVFIAVRKAQADDVGAYSSRESWLTTTQGAHP